MITPKLINLKCPISQNHYHSNFCIQFSRNLSLGEKKTATKELFFASDFTLTRNHRKIWWDKTEV